MQILIRFILWSAPVADASNNSSYIKELYFVFHFDISGAYTVLILVNKQKSWIMKGVWQMMTFQVMDLHSEKK